MTSNQIAARQAREAERANKEREKENYRSNTAKEKLERRGQNIKIADTAVKGVTGLIKSLNPLSFLKKNDPSWYNLDPQLVKDVANLSFNTPLGAPFNNEIGKMRLPGIMVIPFMPTIGMNKGNLDSSAANTASKTIYAYVRHANSGSRNYEAVDLMQYLLAMDSGYSLWGAMRRAYSLALDTRAENRYYNNAMLYALGFNANDIRNNLANFRALINTFAMRLNSFYVPNAMPLFYRHQWLNNVILKDHSVKKSQTYLFVQSGFYHYYAEDGKLSVKAPDNNPAHELYFQVGANITFSQLAEFVNYWINNMLSIEDIGIMSGDILKAYGEGNLYFLPSTEEDFHIPETYSEEILSQVQNTMLTQYDSSNISNFDITQDEQSHIIQGVPLYKVGTTEIVAYGIPTTFGQDLSTRDYLSDGKSYVINMYKDDPTPDDIMVATRNKVGFINNITPISSGDASTKKYGIVTFGTEIFGVATIIGLNSTSGEPEALAGFCMFAQQSTANNALIRFGQIVKFDWAPAVYMFTTGLVSKQDMNTQDYSNYAVINEDVLSNLHDVASLSEFGVPKLGMQVRTR